MLFYDQLMTQKVNSHTAYDRKRSGSRTKVYLTHETKPRRIGKTLELVQTKLIAFFEQKWNAHKLRSAFKDSRVRRVLQKHLANRNIKLKHKDAKVQAQLQRRLTNIGEHGESRTGENFSPINEETLKEC